MAKGKWICPQYMKDTDGTEREVIAQDGTLYQKGVEVTATGAELNVLDASAVGASSSYTYASLPIVAATTETDIVALTGTYIIEGAWVNVATKEDTGTTKTIDIGIKTVDADGLINGLSVATAGLIKPTLLSSGQTLGALMSVCEDGSSALVPEPYVVVDPTFTYSLPAADYEEMVASVLIKWTKLA